MAERDNDEIAAALHGLSGGEPPLPAPVQREKPPASKRPVAPVARPAMPSVPVNQPASVVPSVPVVPPTAVRSSKSGRPVMPGQVVPPPIQVQEPSTAIEPPAETLSSSRPRTHSSLASSGFRQTMIPILLTLGTLMIVMALGPIVFDADAPLSKLPAWSRLLLCLGAVMLLALAAINMLMVRSIERARVAR